MAPNPTAAPPPEQMLMQMVTGKWVSKALAVIADFAIADHLSDGSRSVEELAGRTGTNADALYRLLRAASALGVFEEQPGRRFANNAMSSPMRSDVPGSLRALIRWIGEDSAWQAWSRLDYSVKTGKPAFDHVHGVQAFEYFGRHPESGQVFNDAMVSFTEVTGNAVAKAYDFSPFRKIVDVGGGHGALLMKILDRHPKLRGVVNDLPVVIEGTKPFLAARGYADRIATSAGDFLKDVPAGGDAYIMKHIIHDWDDERCVTILGNCRKAMAAGATVLIVEQVVSERPEAAFTKVTDLEMLVMTPGGRERTEAEFARLLGESGLKMTRLVPTESMVCIVEAVAAS